MLDRCWTVSEVTERIKGLLEGDYPLQDLWVEGEVSNFSRSTVGHVYFTIKDAHSSLRCVMWRSQASRQEYLPRDGDAVMVHGRISVYEPQGQYQLYVDLVQPLGLGMLYMEFEALKGRLEAEGLFAPERKRPLPLFPRRLGLVTSPTGAAIRDVLRILRHRYPLVEVVLAPTLVQGEEAPPQIVAAIEALNDYARSEPLDLIIVTRGGGSLEELWAFNDERVARAIVASRIPVISGVGHEVDFTIADFAADVRAPTPTAAAQMAVPDKDELRDRIRHRQARLIQVMERRLEQSRSALATYRQALLRFSPQARLERYRQRVDELERALRGHVEHLLGLWRERLRARRLQLMALSPLAILERGYSITRHLVTGRIVKSVAEVTPGDPIQVQVKDGQFGARVLPHASPPRSRKGKPRPQPPAGQLSLNLPLD